MSAHAGLRPAVGSPESWSGKTNAQDEVLSRRQQQPRTRARTPGRGLGSQATWGRCWICARPEREVLVPWHGRSREKVDRALWALGLQYRW